MADGPAVLREPTFPARCWCANVRVCSLIGEPRTLVRGEPEKRFALFFLRRLKSGGARRLGRESAILFLPRSRSSSASRTPQADSRFLPALTCGAPHPSKPSSLCVLFPELKLGARPVRKHPPKTHDPRPKTPRPDVWGSGSLLSQASKQFPRFQQYQRPGGHGRRQQQVCRRERHGAKPSGGHRHVDRAQLQHQPQGHRTPK